MLVSREALPGATATLFDPAGCERGFETGDVGRYRVLSLVDHRADADRPSRRARPGRDAPLGVGIDRQKPGSIAPISEACEHDLSGARPLRWPFIQTRPAGFEPAQTRERVTPPGAIVHPVSHRLAEFAVTWNVDADFLLLADHVLHGRGKLVLEALVIDHSSGFTCVIGRDQRIGTRQAPGMSGQNTVATHLHCMPSRATASRCATRHNERWVFKRLGSCS